jgi:predicted CXXCH cytochrome family protein
MKEIDRLKASAALPSGFSLTTFNLSFYHLQPYYLTIKLVNLKLLLIAGIMTTLVVSGCSPETRYRTLSFFFDGVPQPGASTSDASGGKGKGTPKEAVVATKFRYHGPYAARMCEACHQRGGNKLIMPVESLCLHCHILNIQKRNIHGPLASGGCRVCHEPHGSGKPFLLVSEPSKFCFHCHDEGEVNTREVHKTSAGTECTVCHNPHASDNKYLLN